MDEYFELATFAGGCFWCMVQPFSKQMGVINVISGYTGGHTDNPTYEEVCRGCTGHYEAVQISFDPGIMSYEKLLDTFWKQIDPTDPVGQFADKGRQYATAIFYHNSEQRKRAEDSKEKMEHSGMFDKPIETRILPASKFYPAEDYHQDYYIKNPIHYENYKNGSGREAFLKKTWCEDREDREGREDREDEEDREAREDSNETDKVKNYRKSQIDEAKKQLTSMQYKVTQENATEPPFQNEYWNNKREGIYVDVVSGEPLFSSLDKFDSGCGWPSFVKPLNKDNIKEKADKSHFMIRTEVRSIHGDSHLGHVFTDGPQPAGLRYCINSAALKFISVEDLEKEGYEGYKRLFFRG